MGCHEKFCYIRTPDGQKHYYGVVIRKLLYSSKELQLRAAIQQSLNDHILTSFAKRFLRVKLSLCIQTEQASEKNCINDKINLHQHLYCWQSIVTTTTTPV